MAINIDLSSQDAVGSALIVDLRVSMLLFFHYLFETASCFVRRNQRVSMRAFW